MKGHHSETKSFPKLKMIPKEVIAQYKQYRRVNKILKAIHNKRARRQRKVSSCNSMAE